MKFIDTLKTSLLLLIAGIQFSFAQERPTLVVGIVVDQMRYDYLYRFQEKYGENGFKKLLSQGYSFENHHFDYVPTYTGPGHSSIYTGTSPRYHGIVANDWYSRKDGKRVYCAQDTTVKTVGADNDAGKMSPKNLLVNTLGDQIKFATNDKSKVFGIALKDRSAIFPAGHSANGAFWLDRKTGNFISSSYYMNELPAWVKSFNDKRLADSMMAKTWDLLLSPDQYWESTADNMPWEASMPGEKSPVFPHKLLPVDKKKYEAIFFTPFGNDLTFQLALQSIDSEQLGKDKFVDLLAISLSSPDYCGHLFGPNSMEQEDMYIRLDRQLAQFISSVESKVGKGKVLFFLTADHGASPVPEFLQSKKIPAGRFEFEELKKEMEKKLADKYGEGPWILDYYNQQFYLNETKAEEKGIKINEMEDLLVEWCLKVPFIFDAIAKNTLRKSDFNHYPNAQIQKGFYAQRSGNVCITYQQNIFDNEYHGNKGTTHGSHYTYDTQVPFLLYGWKIKAGKTGKPSYTTDIAPSIAYLLHITAPYGAVGKPVYEIESR